VGDREYFNGLAACMTDEHGDHVFTHIVREFKDTVSLRDIPTTQLRTSMMDSSKPVSVRFMDAMADSPLEILPHHMELGGSLKQICDVDVEEQICSKDNLYHLYTAWATSSNEKVRSKDIFCREIKKYVESTKPLKGKKRINSFKLKRKLSIEEDIDGQESKRMRTQQESEVTISTEEHQRLLAIESRLI